ncbi:hypothetical protein [Neobacillus bataviensis]|uniref:hypothetical protein n=1 Tax=Neobacillus bataviensis TaxID=220685 RepID=UPI001CBB3AEF|nr:hypothetical protein [Neobacillus bataviensis]
MSKIEKIKSLVGKAQELQQDTTRMYRLFQEDIIQKQSQIKLNDEYTEKGKQKLIESLKARKTVEFLKSARHLQTEFKKNLTAAKKEAESIVYGKIPQVDPDKMERFKNRFNEVKTEILLASSARRKKDILEEFLGNVDEPGLAVVVKNEFDEVIKPILDEAGTDGMKFRNDLNRAFEDLKVRSMDPEAIEAIQIIEYTDAVMNSRYFSPMVEQNVQQVLGRTAHMYMERPDEYFEQNPEEDTPESPFRSIQEIEEEEEAKKL